MSAAPFPDGPYLYVGGQAMNIQRRRVNLTGRRCFTASHPPRSFYVAEEVPAVRGLLDSGAFTDEERLSFPQALARQLAWEQSASRLWGAPFQAEALVAYDRLIDETWIDGKRQKRRWTPRAAESALVETVAAAWFLSAQRKRLRSQRLVLSVQGVTAAQYEECARGVLRTARPEDVIGLGGWCILGRNRFWLPVFWDAMWRVLPEIAAGKVRRVHLFGCLWGKALGGLLWLTDAYGLALSVDSGTPMLAVTWGAGNKKSGARAATWEANVAWWQRHVSELRSSPSYRRPPWPATDGQRGLFDIE